MQKGWQEDCVELNLDWLEGPEEFLLWRLLI